MEPTAQALNRRQFLIRLGAASATITVVGAGVSAALNTQTSAPSTAPVPSNSQPGAASTEAAEVATAFPNTDDPVQPSPGTRPEYTPVSEHYRIDIAAVPPDIDGASWRLPITGLVGQTIELSLDDIRNNFDPIDQYITMECISNPVAGDLISTTRWTGASFRDVLALAEPTAEATHVRITGADGFDETVALELINNNPEIVLCYAWDGEPLPTRNGFPVRVHIPNHFGMKQPKWIDGMTLIDGDEDGYWVRRGWSKDAFIRATSVIDTAALDEAYEQDGTTFVPIGGIAYAGPRGVSKVEVQVDGGEWQEAQLRAPLNNDLEDYKTWRIWRYDWPFAEGQHSVTVRMYEEDGTPQLEEVNGVRPDGATGLHARRM